MKREPPAGRFPEKTPDLSLDHRAGDATVTPLPLPEVLGCYCDAGFTPPIAAMQLRWPDQASAVERVWRLPNGAPFVACLPQRFAVRILRQAEDAYVVALVWDANYHQWFSLRRAEVMLSVLVPLLAAMDTSLESILDQPLLPPQTPISSAA